MRGFAPDEVVDSAASARLERVHPDDRERSKEAIRKQNTGEIKRNALEYRERHTISSDVSLLTAILVLLLAQKPYFREDHFSRGRPTGVAAGELPQACFEQDIVVA